MPDRHRENFFATCAPGIEPVLEAELSALGMAKVEQRRGGVSFTGCREDAWRANLELRTAIRVLWRLARFRAQDADDLYAGVQSIDWSSYLEPEATLAVTARTIDSALDHTMFIAQRVKDAIVDQERRRSGTRPSVDREDPDLRLYAHLSRDRCTLSIDTSGDSLHKRGWRRFQGRAPLSETLSAAVLSFSGWNRRAPLLDPFCGSGTLLIEGALLAFDHAPGLFRQRFGFERLPGFDASAWNSMRDAARARITPRRKLSLRGWDADPAALDGARENLESAGLASSIELEVARAQDFAPRKGWNAWIVTNPPYGERVGERRSLEAVYQAFGARLREHCSGYQLALLAGTPELVTKLGIDFERRVALENGALKCELCCGEL